jgi:hypothetical protein
MKNTNPHIGSSLDDFLKKEGIYDEITALVTAEKIAYQLKQRVGTRPEDLNTGDE